MDATLSMSPRLQATVHHREDITFLKLAGVIDEDNDLASLAERVGQGTVIVDFGDVERINSCGVRDWVNWLGRVERDGAKVVLVECSPAIVAQVNLVTNFTGQGVVKSFYAPYFCPQCNREKVLLVETRDTVGQTPFRAPTCRCDECDGPMDFDDMEQSYFAFLANTSKIVTDARVEAVVNELTPSESGPRLRTRTGPVGLSTPPSAGSLPPIPSLATPSIPSLSRLDGAVQTPVQVGPSQSWNIPSSSTAAAPSAGLSTAAAVGSLGAQPAGGVAAAMSSPARSAATSAPAPVSRTWMLLAGALLVTAVALLAYMVLGGPSATPPPTETTGVPATETNAPAQR